MTIFDAVFEGGGAKGIALSGGVEALQQRGHRLRRLIGTSAGSITAVNLAVGYTPKDILLGSLPQRDLMAFVPNLPLAGYSPGPSGSQITQRDYLNMLPPLDQAQYQGLLGHLLGSVHHTKLGEYDVKLLRHFADDARLDAPLHAFQERLEQIEEMIDQRNLSRRPYSYLKPPVIPQSINI